MAPYDPSVPLPDDPVDAANMLCQGTLVDRMGIIFVEVSAKRLVATMPVDGNIQPYGLLHGGAHGVLAESVGSVGAGLTAGEGRIGVGIELSASHHRPAMSGLVTATATRLTASQNLTTYESVHTDDSGRRLCTARLTCFLRPIPAQR